MGVFFDSDEIGEILFGGAPIGEVYYGDSLVWSGIDKVPYTGQWQTIGESQTVTPPDWADMADIVVLGAGGGGENGSMSVPSHGNGGDCGEWFFTSWGLSRGREIEFTIGEGGQGSPRQNSGEAKPGGDTFAVPSDRDWKVTGEGGAPGSGRDDAGGKGAPGYTVFNRRFEGSADAGRDTDGSVPGGGGGGGHGGFLGKNAAGRSGGRGVAYIRFSGERREKDIP